MLPLRFIPKSRGVPPLEIITSVAKARLIYGRRCRSWIDGPNNARFMVALDHNLEPITPPTPGCLHRFLFFCVLQLIIFFSEVFCGRSDSVTDGTIFYVHKWRAFGGSRDRIAHMANEKGFNYRRPDLFDPISQFIGGTRITLNFYNCDATADWNGQVLSIRIYSLVVVLIDWKGAVKNQIVTSR